MYEAKGLQPHTARTVAEELTAHDAFAAHVDVELGIDPDKLTNPLHAAASSALAFILGASLPLIAILTPPPAARVPVAFLAVALALTLTGSISGRLSGTPHRRAVLRIVCGGLVAMLTTYAVGHLLGIAGI